MSTYEITFRVTSLEGLPALFDLGAVDIEVTRLASFHDDEAGDDEASDDDVDAADVIAVLAKMNLSHDNKLSRMRDELVSMAERGEHIELSVRDGVPYIDTDPTPPHGIERLGYWIDHSRQPTQGSGRRQPNLEAVPCPACGAPAGSVCMASSHAGYRRSHGHSARYRAYRELMES